QRPECLPIQGEAGGRRLEGDRQTGQGGPDVPQGEGRPDVSVLDRPTVACQPCPDRFRATRETERDQAGMSQDLLHPSWTETQGEWISGSESWRRRSVLRTGVKITRAENNGGETADGIRRQRAAAGEPDLHGAATRLVYAHEARR